MRAPANAAGAEAPRYFRAPLADFGGARPPAPDWFERAVEDAPERSTVEVQGAAIETLAWGRIGDPGLLLMHGNGAHADWFSFIAPLLAREGRRVVALSFSGMGRSGWRDKYSVAQWSDETIAVVEATGLFDAPTAPVLAAHSFGGYVLMTTAARHGQRLRRAIIVDTPLRPPDSIEAQNERRRERMGGGQARFYTSEADALSRFKLMPPQGCEHPFIADHIARHSLKSVLDGQGRPAMSWRFDPALFDNFDFGKPHRDLGQSLCPVVLVRGGRSRLVTPELFDHARSLAPPGTPTHELADADHHVMVDQPLAFTRLLAQLADEL